MSRKKYPEELKEQAVSLSEEIGIPSTASQLGIPQDTLRTWCKNKKQTGIIHIGSGNSKSSKLDSEKASLLKEIKELKRANEILKEVLGFFVVSQKKYSD